MNRPTNTAWLLALLLLAVPVLAGCAEQDGGDGGTDDGADDGDTGTGGDGGAGDAMTANVIAINNDYGSGLADIFKDHFETNLGGRVETVSLFAEGANEFSSQVTEACQGAGDGLDAIVLVAYTDDAAAILRAMEAQGCLDQVQVFASEGVYSPDAPEETFVGGAGRDEGGAWLGAGIEGTTPQAPGSRWVDHYTEAFGEGPDQYAAESYDAVVYLALAALHAGSTEGRAMGESLLAIANGGEKCDTFDACAELLANGTDIDYVGMAHDLTYTDLHEPSVGAYSLWRVGEDGRMTIFQENVLPEGAAEGVAAGGEAAAPADVTAPLTLRLGTMMPLTGALSNLGPSMQSGANLAIEDVNEAGRNLTIEVVGREDDTTTDTTEATNAFNRLVAGGATAVVGPCCSGITGAVLELAVQNEVVVASPSATSPALTERDNEVFFWRVAPTDEGQGRVLAELVADTLAG